MNESQRLWLEQTRSDHSILLMLRRAGANPCHQLHYLQMVTEKLAKTFLWGTAHPPKKSHASFVRFLQALDNQREPHRTRVAQLFGFRRAKDFEHWIPTITPIAHELERLAPSLAGDNGPNPEYPWPVQKPTKAPCLFQFEIWSELTESARGRRLLVVIDAAVVRFPDYG